MEELDLLKKAWQKDTYKNEQISEVEIYKMLHTKSSSIVKWILIISIIELLFWTAISVCYNVDDYMKKQHAENTIVYLKALTLFNYAVIFWFIYCFYKNYIKISTTSSTKQLMQDILKTRKIVQYYVWYNLTMIVLSLIAGFVIAFVYNPKMALLKDKISHESNYHTLLITLGVMVLTCVIVVGLFWLFYRILYGILLRKLNTNYKELKKIDL
jgi:ABC-type Fe3+ transport system permease subunit